jgi:hypothetical protein
LYIELLCAQYVKGFAPVERAAIRMPRQATALHRLYGWPLGCAGMEPTPAGQDRARSDTVKLPHHIQETFLMAVGAKIAKTADRKKVMDTTKSTDCPKCGKATRIVKRVKDRERGIPGGIYISCSGCEFFEKL